MTNLIELREAQEEARKQEQAHMVKVGYKLDQFPDDGVGNDGHRQD